MKILFLGNSHTYFHDMPELFACFAEKTTGEKPFITMLAYSGRDLAWHRREYFSLRFNLMYGGYDFCVIQQAAHPYPPTEQTLTVGAEIIKLCRENHVTPVVYMTWAEKAHPENQQIMIDTCRKLAHEESARLAPIGEIWSAVLNAHPDIELYHTDGAHAGPYGDFLIAAVLCKTIFGDVSEDVIGSGHDFLKGRELDFSMPELVCSPYAVRTELCTDKTKRIIEAVRAY